MNKYLFLVCLFVASGRVSAQPINFESAGEFKVVGSAKEPYELIFRLAKKAPLTTEENTAAEHAGFSLGCQHDMAKTIVTARLKWFTLPTILLAESAFSDLCDPNTIEITQKGANVMISIVGSDAGWSYRALIEVAHYGVVHRTVYHAMSGHTQVTRYQTPSPFVKSFDEQLRKARYLRDNPEAEETTWKQHKAQKEAARQ